MPIFGDDHKFTEKLILKVTNQNQKRNQKQLAKIRSKTSTKLKLKAQYPNKKF